MARYTFYQIDAFASRPFEGNQACVMPMDAFLPDNILQAIASENNVAETAFLVPVSDGRWQLRWFTPTVEVPLCGHATLASAHVLFAHEGFDGDAIIFETRKSGDLIVERSKNGYVMDFPRPDIVQLDITQDIVNALGAEPVAIYGGGFFGAIFEAVDDVISLKPNSAKVKALASQHVPDRGNIGCLALGGDNVDVTSRFFAPGSGIDEDPATGSWHCLLAAMVQAHFGREELSCFQAYPGRGAHIGTEIIGNRVKLSGEAVTVIEGQFTI